MTFKTYYLFILLLGYGNLHAQESPLDYQELTLSQAIKIGLSQNKTIQANQVDMTIAAEREKEAAEEKLPEIDFHTGYGRLSNLNQYEHGGVFSKPVKYESIREKYDFTVDASIPLYMGGKLKAMERKSALETKVSSLKFQKSEKELKLEIITAFLQIYHLMEQEKLVALKMKEDSVTIKQVEVYIKNGVVTQNEVLRTKLQLSNHKMLRNTVVNDINIAKHELLTILSLPEKTAVGIQTQDLYQGLSADLPLDEYLTTALVKNENLLIAGEAIELKKEDKKIVKSNYMPVLSLMGDYGFQYPNYMFFPPEPYLNSLGTIGLDLKFSISGLYKNKTKMKVVNQELVRREIELADAKEKVNHKVFRAYNKFAEAGQKIDIAEEAIMQARENYRIVKTKYANQLSLITELIDADNAYMDAESALITHKIDRQLKYYQLQYEAGNL